MLSHYYFVAALSVFSTFQTRVFVTNAITFLPRVDEIIVLKDGEIAERGSYEELLTQEGAFAEFLQTYLQEAEDSDSESTCKYGAIWWGYIFKHGANCDWLHFDCGDGTWWEIIFK